MALILDASFFATVKTLISVHFIATLVVYALIAFLGFSFGKRQLRSLTGRPVLVITAHPDDECMFFAPAILGHTVQRIGNYQSVHLLCLSNGNYYGKGKVREKEILRSCQILGLSVANVTVVNDNQLPDSPTADWKKETLEAHVQNAIEEIQPEVVYSFDGYGVSGHNNHIAVHQCIKNIFSSGNKNLPTGVRAVYFLESVSLWRKYLGVFDLPFTLLSSSHVAVAGPQEIIRAQKAMLAHRSQLEWFRFLYILLSRYMVINSFSVHTL
ncbi:hypothetical protein BaRGS_00037371 [Batillaria attramentaria]|uniref:N-acetylglucosaminylphosphatidylinositol deacetylase n=1 Tax=Batillaria attramentaria TaxID=370345 RepID=A0ABD0J917_9CAEN